MERWHVPFDQLGDLPLAMFQAMVATLDAEARGR